jgi:hypothetical protein
MLLSLLMVRTLLMHQGWGSALLAWGDLGLAHVYFA